MKKRQIFLCMLLLLFGFSVSQAMNYESYSGFIVDEKPVLPSKEIHPSLWFSQAEVNNINQRRNADEYSKVHWQAIMDKVKNYRDKQFPAIPDAKSGKDVERYYGTMSKSIRYLAFGWLMTGDRAARDKAIEGLMRSFDGPMYTMDPKKDSVGIDAIYIATWVQNYCSAYDWLYDQLTPDQNKEIRTRLIKMANWINQNVDIWGPRPHNHRSKPAWALGTLALTLSSEPQAKDWLAHALRSTNTNTKYFFSEDGIYREGSHYLAYSMVNFLPFLYEYKNVSGVNNFPIFQPVFDWMLKVRNGKGWLPNIEDAYNKPTPLQMVAKEYMDVVAPLNPNAKLGNLYQWSYFNSDLKPWGGMTGSYTGASIDDSWDLDEYLTYDPNIKPIAPTASPIVFMNGGQTIFRNNWKYNDPSTRYLLFQGVAEADNHNHEDQLSFIIQAENQMMASDSGYSTGSYNDQERKDWYLKAEAHNVVMLNGEYPQDPGENLTPLSRFTIATDFCAFQEKIGYFPKSNGQVNRAIAFPGLDYFVVTDQLTGEGESSINLHGGRGIMTGQGNFRMWDYKADEYGDAARMAVWTLPAGAKLVDGQGAVTYVKGDATKFSYIKASQTTKDALFMQVIVPLSISSKLPVLTDLSSTDYLAAQLQKDQYQDCFVLQKANKSVKAGLVETNGSFAWVRSDGVKAIQWQLRQASILRVNGKDLFSSSLPVSLAISYENGKMTGFINALTGSYKIKLCLPEGKTVDSITFGGESFGKFKVDKDTVELTLTGSGNLTIILK